MDLAFVRLLQGSKIINVTKVIYIYIYVYNIYIYYIYIYIFVFKRQKKLEES